VAYTSLLQDRRRALHARILEATERLSSDRIGEHVDRLAHHAFRGEAWEKAAIYLRQAGAKAFAHSANRQAVTCYEQALTALSNLPETREQLAQVIDLRFDLRTSLFPLGEIDKILGHLQEAERLARVLDDERRLGWVSVYMAHYSQATGDSCRAQELARAAHTLGDTLEDFPLQVAARFYLGWSGFSLGDYGGAESHLRRVMALLEGDRRCERCNLTGFPAVMARWILARCLAARGELDEGIAVGREGIRIAEELDHAYSLILACWGPVDAHRLKGELDEAIRLTERAVALCRDRGVTVLSPLVGAALGDLYARSGRLAEGVALLEDALRAIESMRGGSSWDADFRVRLGEAYARAGRLDGASRAAEQALALARERSHRGYEAHALLALGEIAALSDPPEIEAAQACYRQSLALAEERGMRPLVAHCHLHLGRLYGRVGKRQEAEGHLARAATLYREMDMPSWLEQADSEGRARA
jgi:tetratricopeptide (TPR) repeat protein